MPKPSNQATHVVNVLKNNFKDLKRANLFIVEMKPVGSSSNDASYIVPHNLVKSVNIPGITIGKIEIVRATGKVFIPGDPEYGDLTIGFHDDMNHYTRSFITNWMKGYVMDYERGFISKSVKVALTSGVVEVIQLDRQMNYIRKYKMKHCFPVSIDDTTLDHDTESSGLSFSVGFAYSYHVEESV